MTVTFPIVALSDGEVLDPQWISDITEAVNTLASPGWTDYSSSYTITGTTTSPTFGNSTVAAFYRYSAGGDVLDYKARIIIGSTFSAGSGNYVWNTPLPSVNDGAPGVGVSHTLDNGTGFYPGNIRFLTASTLEIHPAPLSAVRSLPLGSTGPGTAWATGDMIEFAIRYRIATA